MVPPTDNNRVEWKVRPAGLDDAHMLAEFNWRIAVETEGKELDRSRVTRGVRRGLQLEHEVRYFVAESVDGPLGCLMLTREWSDWRDGWLIWIQSVYVRPEYRGQGVFRSLLEHVRLLLQQEQDVVGLRLYVEAENQRAQDVYRRTGFSDPNYRVLELLF